MWLKTNKSLNARNNGLLMIIFKKLIIHNFMAIESISLDLDARGIVLIDGKNLCNSFFDSNGSGKSSLYESLLWCLWGNTIRGYRGDEVIARRAKKNTIVELTLTDKNKNRWCVTRYRKHKEYKNGVILKCGKRVWNEEVKVQNKINGIIGMDFKSYTSTFIVHRADDYKPFSAMTDGEMKSLLKKLYDLEKYSLLEGLSKKHILRLISDNDDNYRKKACLVSKSGELAEDVEDLIRRQVSLTSTTKKELIDIKTKISQIGNTEEVIFLLEKKKRIKTSVIKKLQKPFVPSYDREDTEMDLGIIANGILSYKLTTNSILEKLDIIKESIVNFSNLEGRCPTCKQAVREGHSETHIKRLHKDQKELKNEFLKIEKKIGNQCKSKRLLEARLSLLKKELIDFNDERLILTEKKGRLSKSIVLLQSEVNASETQEESLRKEYKAKKGLLKDNIYITLIEKKKLSIKDLLHERNNLCDAIQKVDNKLTYYQFFEDAFSKSKIPSFLLDNLLPVLNRYATKYSSILTGGTLNIRFNNQTSLKSKQVREKFSITVENEFGASEYKGDSSGEKRRVDLCVLFALQKVAMLRSKNNFNVLWIDEIFDSLDISGVEQAVSLLEDEADTYPTIFVISHSSELISYFDNIITIKKKNGVSTISQ